MAIIEQTPTSAAALVDEHGIAPRGPIAVAWTFLRRQPIGAIGIILVLIFGLGGIFADWIAPYNPTANDFSAMTEPPSWAHWLGTDQLGRDLLSRILFGARTAFIVGMTAQTSDTAITTTEMRKMNLLHAIVSFFFNTVLVAAVVNAAVALASTAPN